MDRLGIATSLLSISTPGVHLADDAAARDLAREVNEAGRRAVVDHPGRFGLLGSLPLPDVDAAIAEIAHCIDHLDVDGFVLLTNVGGTYLGDPAWDPVFRELDRRGAPRAHPPDVARLLGAHVVRAAAADARVPVRHHARRREPRAQRHGRAAPGPSPHRPARRRDAPGHRRPRRRSSPSRWASTPRSTSSATSATSTTTSPGHRSRASSTRCSRSRRSSTSTTAATSRSRPTSSPRMATERLDAAGDPPGSLAEALRANTERLFPRLSKIGDDH